MSVLHRNNRNARAEPVGKPAPEAAPEPAPEPAPSKVEPPEVAPGRPVSRTRTSAAWLGICVAAAIFVVLIIFLLQNTANVEVSFLWLHGSLPLAIALLIAGVGTALLTMMVGVARITQLRRRYRRDH